MFKEIAKKACFVSMLSFIWAAMTFVAFRIRMVEPEALGRSAHAQQTGYIFGSIMIVVITFLITVMLVGAFKDNHYKKLQNWQVAATTISSFLLVGLATSTALHGLWAVTRGL